MLAEFVKAVSDQAVKAARGRILKPSAEPEHVYLIEDASGKIDQRRAAPQPRRHKALSLDPIIEFAKLRKISSAIWYSRHGVVCLVDDNDRRDRIDLNLQFSQQIEQLSHWEKTRPRLSHKDAINILRTTFAKCLAPAGEFLGLIRQLKFVNGQIDEANLQASKRSIGRSIEQSVTGVATIPEYVTFDVPVFANAFPFRASVEIAVDIDPATQTFQFVPLPKEIEAGIEAAEDALYSAIDTALDGVKVPVYHGNP
jgi:hypothetical protein